MNQPISVAIAGRTSVHINYAFSYIQQFVPRIKKEVRYEPIKSERQLTLKIGSKLTRASHNIRQESSPTLQNSCALHKI